MTLAWGTQLEPDMQHPRIAFYDHVSGDYEELANRAETGRGAILREEPGFVSYSSVATLTAKSWPPTTGKHGSKPMRH